MSKRSPDRTPDRTPDRVPGGMPDPVAPRAPRPVVDPVYAVLVAAGPLGWALLAIWLPTTPGTLPPADVLLRAVLVAPVLEELAFRGLVQGILLERAALARRFAGVSGANVATSIAFAAAHLVSQSPLQAVAVLLPSLAFGACRDRYGGTLPGMFLHAFYNAGFLWLYGGP